MQEFKDRLKIARKNAKMTQVELAKAVKTSQGSISDLESGRNKTSTNIVEIAKVLKVSPNWLATGQGEMAKPAKPTVDELRLKRDEIQGKINDVEHVKPIYMYPVINEVQAGQFTEIGDDSFDEYKAAHRKGSYWLKIKGDSMTPDFRQGDLILVDQERVASTGNYVVALVAGEQKATFKKYRECFDGKNPYYELIALNDFYPTIDSRVKPFQVIGVVVEHSRGLL